MEATAGVRQRRGLGNPSSSAGDASADASQAAGRNKAPRKGSKWSSLALPLIVLAVVRAWAAGYSAIADCDETFNYWEPSHFLAFGRGFQTWEYSPVYALRSYLFLLPHTYAAYGAAALVGRPAAFFTVRGLQACVAVMAEGSFVSAASSQFGDTVGQTLAWLLVMSPGMFTASVAFLPSSISMLQVCIVWAFWMTGRHCAAIFVGMAAVVAVWPFTGLLFVPLGLHTLWKSPFRGIAAAIASMLFWVALSVCVDSHYYGRIVLPSWQIIRYNILDRGTKGGPELYGVEPWTFYFANGFLNLVLSLPLATALPLVALLQGLLRKLGRKPSSMAVEACLYCAAAFVWFAFFSTIPHKEERFLAPTYPIILLGAAVAAHGAVACASVILHLPMVGIASRLPVLALIAVVLANGMLSFMRISALQTGYAAPVDVYAALNRELIDFRTERGVAAGRTHVCIGAEWHRFMTSFFLPHDDDHLVYVTFGPTGLLPAEFDIVLGTSGKPPNMNDLNMEEHSRYVDRDSCHFLVDLDFGTDTNLTSDMAALRREPGWSVVAQAPFLDAGKSRFPWRAFNVPRISHKKNTFAPYRLLKRGR